MALLRILCWALIFILRLRFHLSQVFSKCVSEIFAFSSPPMHVDSNFLEYSRGRQFHERWGGGEFFLP